MRETIARCECPELGHRAYPAPGRGHHGPLEWAHIVKRSQGGHDTPGNTLVLCRGCHRWFDAHVGKTARRVAWAAPALAARPAAIRDALDNFMADNGL